MSTIQEQSSAVKAQGNQINIVSDDSLFFSNPAQVAEEYFKTISVLEKNSAEGVQQLETLAKKYSDEPALASHLADAHRRINNNELADQIVKDNYRKFPLSVFARSDYAHLCLKEHHPMAAAAAVDYTFDITQLYPTRSRFHVLEIMDFQTFLVNYFCAIKDFERAVAAMNFLQTIDKKMPGIDVLKTTIMAAIMKEFLSPKSIDQLFEPVSKDAINDQAAEKATE